MQFCLVIHFSKKQTVLANSAYQFAQKIIQEKHTINCVFFQYNGADHYIDAHQNNKTWSTLAQQAGFPLIVCIGSAHQLNIDNKTPHPHFTLGSLSILIEAIEHADKVVTFPKEVTTYL